MALGLAVIVVALILLTGGSSYTVKALFENASQIVPGDLVEVGGVSVGTVSDITLNRQGLAQLTLSISDGNYQPLHRGTQATIRELSLSGIASRYIDLTLGAHSNPTIPNGGVIGETHTTSEVDLDQLFDTLDAPTRKGLQNLIQGTASQYAGKAKLAQQAWQYLNPAVAASSQLFAELNANTPAFSNFVTKSGQLLGDIATRQSQLSGVVENLSQVTSALASQHVALGQSIGQLPGFMKLADTTFVNLRSSLHTLTPLVNESKPVAPKLEKLLVQLRPLAQQSVPTVNDLANIVSKPGPGNDLIDLTRLGRPLAAATVDNITVDGKSRRGGFPETTTALNNSVPELAFARPYAVDLTGWFEGFSHPGGQDAEGSYSRVAPFVGVGSLDSGALNLLAPLLNPALRSVLAFGTGGKGGSITTSYGDRCPGSMERGAMYYPESGYACDPNEIPTGR
jgi:phospholipid/cholesterol/gamma-HCH transport system substrate-binding protein